jgi:hypothetical protein
MTIRRVALVDAASLHHMMDAIAVSQDKGQVRLDFPAMQRFCADCIAELMHGRMEEVAVQTPANQHLPVQRRSVQRQTTVNNPIEMRVYCSVDPGSAAQKRLAQSWEAAGFTFVGLDFRACSPSPSPSNPVERQQTSNLAVPIAYALGTLRRHANVTVLLVSHAFDLAAPMQDLMINGATVGLASFKTYLDQRWIREKVIGLDSGEIPFFDLEEKSTELLGQSLTGDPDKKTKSQGLGF